jgi:hypothetical protein
MMDPGWLVLCLALALECFLVGLLILPVPSNKVRGAINTHRITLHGPALRPRTCAEATCASTYHGLP